MLSKCTNAYYFLTKHLITNKLTKFQCVVIAKVKNELKIMTRNSYSENWYDEVAQKIDNIYNNVEILDFKNLLKPIITNNELFEFVKSNLGLNISKKKSHQFFTNYLRQEKIKYQKTNSNGVRGFLLSL